MENRNSTSIKRLPVIFLCLIIVLQLFTSIETSKHPKRIKQYSKKQEWQQLNDLFEGDEFDDDAFDYVTSGNKYANYNDDDDYANIHHRKQWDSGVTGRDLWKGVSSAFEASKKSVSGIFSKKRDTLVPFQTNKFRSAEVDDDDEAVAQSVSSRQTFLSILKCKNTGVCDEANNAKPVMKRKQTKTTTEEATEEATTEESTEETSSDMGGGIGSWLLGGLINRLHLNRLDKNDYEKVKNTMNNVGETMTREFVDFIHEYRSLL